MCLRGCNLSVSATGWSCQWLEAPWKSLIEQGLREAFLFGSNDPGEADPEAELADTLQHLSRRQTHANLHAQVDKISSKDYAQLSDEEKLLLKQSLSEMHQKRPH